MQAHPADPLQDALAPLQAQCPIEQQQEFRNDDEIRKVIPSLLGFPPDQIGQQRPGHGIKHRDCQLDSIHACHLLKYLILNLL